jgi:5'(3')-deoxyribonucleotidase
MRLHDLFENNLSTERGRLEYYLKKPIEEGMLVRLYKLGKFHQGPDPLAEIVPERNGTYALHPDKWESTFYSLTNKDFKKIGYYKPIIIEAPANMIVADMAIANQFYRTDDPNERNRLANAYKDSMGKDVSSMKMPEVILPSVTMESLFEDLDPKSELYVDMDGVLADFFGVWNKMMGVKHWKDIPDIDKALQKIKDTDDFWINLPMTPNGKSLLNAIKKFKGKYNILSAPLPGDPNSEPQKRAWIRKHLSMFPPAKIIIDHNKAAYAKQADGTPNALIDDFGENISKWRSAGGVGIQHKDIEVGDTISKLAQELEDGQEPVEENLAGGSLTAQQMLNKLSKEMQGTHTGASDPNSDWSKYVLSHNGFTLKDIQVDQIPTAVKSDGMSQANIEKYKQADTSQFPPMVIGNNGYLLDGNHRLQAYKAQGIKTVKAYIGENFADGKKKGKSRPGRVKRSGASCNGSVTELRAKAKKASGEKAKMYHWCANMKGGKKK